MGKSSFPCLPTGLCPAGTSEKKRTTEDNRKHRPHQTQTFHQIRSIGKCGRQGNISPHLSSLYRYTHACVRKKGGVPTVPVNSLQSAKGSEEITPHGREVIFAMFKGTSRHPSQDYKNFGTRFRGSCTKFHRILQQCAPLFFGLCFLSTFHSSTIHFSILRVSALKFTPILKSFRLSEAKGSA